MKKYRKLEQKNIISLTYEKNFDKPQENHKKIKTI